MKPEEFYSMRELIKFLQRQYNEGYIAIEAIVNLMSYKSKNLPEEKKPQIILDTFRRYGLYEVGFEGEKTFNEAPKIVLPDNPEALESKVDWLSSSVSVQFEEYHIRVLNCTAKFASFMN